MVLNSTNKKITIFWMKALVAVFVLALLVQKISWRELYAAALNAQHGWITAATILLIPNLLCQFRRWQLIARRLHPDTSNAVLIRSLFAGITLGFITPGRVGDLGRTVFIPKANWLGLVGLMLVEKWYALLIVYFFGLLGLIPFLMAAFRPELWMPMEITGLALVLAGIGLALSPGFLSYVLKRFDKVRKRQRLHQILAGIAKLTPKLSFYLLLYTITQVAVYFMQFYFLIKAFTPLPLLKGLSAISSIMWSKTMLPISFGDLGIRESASVYFLSKLQVPAAAAFDSALLLFGINILLPAIVGFIVLLKSRILQNSND
jgi:uncharacterized membrane protein YbhN (UPF0104 family)